MSVFIATRADYDANEIAAVFPTRPEGDRYMGLHPDPSLVLEEYVVDVETGMLRRVEE